jgi:predicted aconitase with swiveling domain
MRLTSFKAPFVVGSVVLLNLLLNDAPSPILILGCVIDMLPFVVEASRSDV